MHADRILVVDDEPANLLLLRFMLEREGYAQTASTTDPRQALPLFRSFRPDLVMLDLHMPGLDGFAVLEQLRAEQAASEYLPVLMLTGDDSPDARLRALAGGASDFLVKPFDAVEVILRIRNLLDTRRLHAALNDQNRQLEQRVAERTRELEVALRHAEAAREAKVHFLAKMSHELRTPLNPIRGALELLRGVPGQAPPEPVVRLVDMASRNVDRMAELINEILYLQSIEQGQVALERYPVHLGVLAAEVAERAEAAARARGLRLEVEVPPGVRPVPGDAIRLGDVLWRLVDNALRFTPEGGVRIRVVADAEGRPRGIEVSDTGIGIPPDRLEAIFEPFEQADNSSTRRYEGAGIGLALCQALCGLMGCRLAVQSEPGRGSTFRVELD